MATARGQCRSDPRRRRAGAAVIAMQSRFGEWVPWGGILSGLDGPFQTVPRAELLAFALALEHSVGVEVEPTPAAPWGQP
eukprot:5538068-Pyramimonas_sp.AAC.1